MRHILLPHDAHGKLRGSITDHLIRRSGEAVQDRPLLACGLGRYSSVVHVCRVLFERLGYSLGYSRGAAALIPDRLLFSPGISPVAARPCKRGWVLSTLADGCGRLLLLLSPLLSVSAGRTDIRPWPGCALGARIPLQPGP